MRIGICTKCGKEGNVVMHHTKGYEGDNKDFVLPYCRSCHAKIHLEARRYGRCKISPKELARLSGCSVNRRKFKECKQIEFRETLIPNVVLDEIIRIFPNRINVSSCFIASNNKKLYEIEIV